MTTQRRTRPSRGRRVRLQQTSEAVRAAEALDQQTRGRRAGRVVAQSRVDPLLFSELAVEADTRLVPPEPLLHPVPPPAIRATPSPEGNVLSRIVERSTTKRTPPDPEFRHSNPLWRGLSDILDFAGVDAVFETAEAGLKQLADTAPLLFQQPVLTRVEDKLLGKPGSVSRRQAERQADEEFELLSKMADTLFFDQLDIAAQTIKEGLEATGNLAQRDFNELQLPTVVRHGLTPEGIERGSRESRDKFRSLPLWQQFAYSLINPLGFLRGGRLLLHGGRSILRGGVKRSALEVGRPAGRRRAATVGGKRGTEVLRSISDAEKQVERNLLRTQNERTNIPALSSTSDVLDQITPRDHSGGAVSGFFRRLADPSSEIIRYEAGSTERLVLEADVVYKRLTEQGRIATNSIMSRVQVKGNPNDLFGISGKIGDEPRARAITHTSDGKVLTRVPFAGDVFERPDNFRLTTDQRAWIDFVHKLNADALSYARAEGVDIKELGEFDDLFYFFPRRAYNPAAKKQITSLYSTRRTALSASRLNETMEAKFLEKGGAWQGPIDAMTNYIESIYDSVVRKRIETMVEPFARTQKVPQFLIDNAAHTRVRVNRMDRAIRDLQHARFGFIPRGATVAAIKRAFPNLSTEIDEVLRIKPTDATTLIGRVSEATLRAARVTPRRLRDALLDAENTRILSQKRARVNTMRSVNRAKRRYGLPDDEAYDLAVKYQQLAARVRKVEDRIDASGPPSPEANALLRAGRDREFSQARGYTPEEITEFFDEFVPTGDELLKKVDGDATVLHELEAAALGTVNPVTGRKARVHFLTDRSLISKEPPQLKSRANLQDASAIHDAIRSLSLRSADEARLIKELEQAYEAGIKQQRNSSVGALIERMRPYRDLGVAEAQEATNARHRARLATATNTTIEGTVPSINSKLIFPRELAQELERHISDQGLGPWTERVVALMSALRNIKTVVDVGGTFVQMLPVLFYDPDAWGKATTRSIRSLIQPRVRAQYIADNTDDLTEYLQHGGAFGSTEFTEAVRDGGWVARFPNTIESSPIIPTDLRPVVAAVPRALYWTTERFSTSFDTLMDVGRLEMWKGLRPTARNKKELNELAVFVNNITGTTSSRALGVPLAQRQVEGLIPFFAPNNAHSNKYGCVCNIENRP